MLYTESGFTMVVLSNENDGSAERVVAKLLLMFKMKFILPLISALPQVSDFKTGEFLISKY